MENTFVLVMESYTDTIYQVFRVFETHDALLRYTQENNLRLLDSDEYQPTMYNHWADNNTVYRSSRYKLNK